MDKVYQIIAETFRVKPHEISDDMTINDFERWDSLTHMELITSLENELEIEFTTDEIAEMTSVQKIKDIISEK